MINSERFARIVSAPNFATDLRVKSVRGALFTAGSIGLDMAVRLATTLVLARLLLPSDFGIVGMVLVITGIAEQLSQLGLSTATIQAREITHRQCSNLFWANVGAGFAFGSLIFLSAPLIAAFYQEEKVTAIAMVIATYFLSTGLTVQHEALLNRQMRQPETSALRVSATVVSAVFAVVLALLGFGYWALVWRELARGMLVAIGVWIRFPWIPGLPSRRAGTRKLLRFGMDLTFAQIFVVAIMRLDSVLIGRIAGAGQLGMYRQGQNLLAPIEVLNAPIQGVAQPGLSSLQTEPERYRRYYERVVSLVGLLTIPIGAFCAIYAEEIVNVVLGPNWVGTAIFLKIVAIGAAVRPVVATSSVVLITLGKHKTILVLAIVHSVLMVAFMVMGIPWGAVGIAAAHLLATIVLMFPKLHYSFVGSPVTMRMFCGSLSQPVLATSAMGIALFLLHPFTSPYGNFYSLSIGIVAGAAIYLGFFAALPGGQFKLRLLCSDVIDSLWRRSARVEGEPEAV